MAMKTKIHIGLLLLSASMLVAADALEEKRSPKADAAAKTIREQIRAELQKLPDHPWAGEYYLGDGLGLNISLSLAPAAGYLFEWHGCLGLYDRNYGAVTCTNGHLRLSFTFTNQPQGFQGILGELIPISWGPRHYLVGTNEMAHFCNQVNAGREPRDDAHGLCLLRRGDEKKKAEGLPTIPPEYAAYLLKTPIEAAILSVGKTTTETIGGDIESKETTVKINAGSQQGVFVGMEFHVTKPDNIFGVLRITKVESNQAEGTIEQLGKKTTLPAPGWQLSTASPWKKRK